MLLTNVTIHKYKSIATDQSFDVEDGISVLVGMNEAGKTSILEAIAKVNYFTDDDSFEFNATHDFPRKEKKKIGKSGQFPNAITLTYSLNQELINKINMDVGAGVFVQKTFQYSKNYENKGEFKGLNADIVKFVDQKLNIIGLNNPQLSESLKKCLTKQQFDAIIEAIEDEATKTKLLTLANYYQNAWNWQGDPLSEYIARVHITPNSPKFLYYDEYYSLPSEVLIEQLVEQSGDTNSEEYKTAKALFELADIDVNELIKADDFEDFVAELEATQALISDELFKYWSANKNLKIRFAIDKKIESVQNQYNKVDKITRHYLNIRVENTKTDMSLPLKNRSKGFNWFFSFLVWFKKIQEDQNSKYILLLDEPGLNLHATAQEDLLKFFKDLCNQYQIIYTTHSPFMIDSNRLNTVRTVVEAEGGTKISETIQEKDPRTLFPLQAALGYNIAQNLFISKNNLLVEGVSDLLYLTTISELYKANGKTGLRDDVTIVPVGGLEKVATFISLLNANKLGIVCLLDSHGDPKGKAKLENLAKVHLIKEKQIKYFDAYVSKTHADIEDLFEPSEYLALFNDAYKGEYSIAEAQLESPDANILFRINQEIGKAHFNHYLPARIFATKPLKLSDLHPQTIQRFETVFSEVNNLF
jgi:predicted ATP-dependent endonuclease of OLD family